MTEKPDSYYINLVLSGRTDAFGELLKRYRNLVFTLCVKIIGNPNDAEDVAQEVFVKIYQSLHKFNGKSKFSSWMYRIAYNACMDFLKKNKRIQEKEHDASSYLSTNSDSIEDDMIGDEKKQFIQNTIDRLPSQEKAIMTLYYYQDESIKGIAKSVGISESNVKIKLHRCRKVLHETFSKEKELLDI